MLETKHSICDYADVSEELANRIYNNLNQYISFDQFCEILKTKEITYSRISRALLHIMLGVIPTSTHIKQVRILGFRTKHTDLFSAIKEWGSIDLISKLSDAVPMPDIDIQAANLYESVITDKFNTNFINEYEHPIIRI